MKNQTDLPDSPELTASFNQFSISKAILDGLSDMNISTPTPVQTQSIPRAMAGKDLTVQAVTGSGKTASFMIPLLSKIKNNGENEALVLTPTRELAHQITQEFVKLSKHLNVSHTVVIGGEDSYRQLKNLNNNTQIIIATPGRMLDHIKSGRLKKFAPKFIVLDEADEMLDMGFIEDVQEIIEACPENRQTMCFSATMPREILKLANRYLKDPEHIALVDKSVKHADIVQRLYVMKEGEKLEALLRLIATDQPDRAIVFCKTRKNTDELAQKLVSRNMNARALHGDMVMEARLKTVGDFRNGSLKILIATDVASRGLDISGGTHVYNYHLAENNDRYTHRIGRTGRAGNKGVATTFATINEIRKNPFFRGQSYQSFNLSTVPTASKVFDTVSQALFQEIVNLESTAKAEKQARRLLKSGDPEEVLAKYITYVQLGIKTEKNDKVGFTPDEISAELKFLKKRDGAARSGGRSGSRRDGARGRSGGFRVNRSDRSSDKPRSGGRWGSKREGSPSEGRGFSGRNSSKRSGPKKGMKKRA